MAETENPVVATSAADKKPASTLENDLTKYKVRFNLNTSRFTRHPYGSLSALWMYL